MRRQRGDTIVEAVIAFAVFGAIAVGAMVIMNRGVAMAQRSLEVTLVREQMDGQADMLRYLKDVSGGGWSNLTNASNLSQSPQPISSNASSCVAPPPSSKAFFLSGSPGNVPQVNSASGASYGTPTTYALVDHPARKSSNIWIEATRAEGSSPEAQAFDFRIHACWSSVGSDNPITLGTIVRLYAK